MPGLLQISKKNNGLLEKAHLLRMLSLLPAPLLTPGRYFASFCDTRYLGSLYPVTSSAPASHSGVASSAAVFLTRPRGR